MKKLASLNAASLRCLCLTGMLCLSSGRPAGAAAMVQGAENSPANEACALQPHKQPALPGKLSSPQQGMWLYEDLLMATALRIEIYCDGEQGRIEQALLQALAKADGFVAQASAHDAESNIGRFNQPDFSGRMHCGRELFACLQLCSELQALSGGAFDASCGEAVRLWRRARQQGQLPDASQVAAARANSGWAQLQLDAASQTVAKKNPHLRLDLGGIGKGFVVDLLFESLRAAGLERACVAIAGDVRVGEPPPGRKHWRVGVALLEKNRSMLYVNLRNAAISSSGDLYQGAIIAGHRYSHIIDPRSAMALQECDAVSVIASRCALSDALATTACVMGASRDWNKLAARFGCAAVFARQGDNQAVMLKFSNGFEAYRDKDFINKQ